MRTIVYVGWIGGRTEDRAALEALGVRVIDVWNRDRNSFDKCEVPESALERFRQAWGPRFLWGLRREVRDLSQAVDEDIPF